MRGVILMCLHEYARATEQFMAAAEFNPQSAGPHGMLALVYWVERKIPEALSEERTSQILASSPERLPTLEELGAVYATSGFTAASRRYAQYKERAYHGDEDEAYAIATQYGIAGDKEKALEWLNRASGLKRRNPWFMLRAPAFDFMRADPRFQDLMHHMGLPP